MKQRLPDSELRYLRSLSDPRLQRDRVKLLCHVGWSLAAVADAFDPPKSRSSIRAWALSKHPVPEPKMPLPLPDAPESAPGASTRRSAKRRVYSSSSPTLSAAQRRHIARLAPLARRYRSKASPSGVYAQANRELTDICVELYAAGASVRELALAAGVTYRAMARRIGVGR